MKTLWALEPFHQDIKKTQMMHSFIKQFSPDENDIEVGFIATRDIQSLNLAFNIPKEERYSAYPKKVILQNLKKAKISLDQQNIFVRDVDTVSTTKAVESFLDIAKKQNSELIAIFTQDKNGFKKFTLGSFAETAMELSPKNLLIVSPNVKPIKKFSTIIYATDFQSNSKEDIQEMLDLSLRLNSKIIIYHHSLDLALLKKDKQNFDLVKRKKKIDDFSDWIQNQARIKKAKVKIIIEGSFLPVSEALLKTAKKEKANLVAVTSKKQGIKIILTGSTTRQIVRQSDIPVLVIKN